MSGSKKSSKGRGATVEGVPEMPLYLSQWSANKLVNPHTGRTIKEGGPTYKELEDKFQAWSLRVSAQRVSPTKASTSASPSPSPSSTEKKEKALKVFMEKVATEGERALAFNVAQTKYGLMKEYEALKIPTVDEKDITAGPITLDLIKKLVNRAVSGVTQRIWKRREYTFRVSEEAMLGIRERMIRIVKEARGAIRWKGNMPKKNLEDYVDSKLDKYAESEYHFMREPNYEFAKMHADQHVRNVLRTMRRDVLEAEPELAQQLLRHFALPLEVTTVLARYVEASLRVYVEFSVEKARRRTAHMTMNRPLANGPELVIVEKGDLK